MKPGLVLVTAFFAACATPDAGTVAGTSTAKGPDLGNFVVTDDLASAAHDFATPLDLGVSLDEGVADLAIAHDLSTPPDLSTGCGTVTYAGSCKNDVLTYCYENAVQTITCDDGTQCTTVSGDSDCRYVNGSACGPVDEGGVCDGDTLAYCDDSSDTLSVTDCSASGLSCVSAFGFADCE